MHLPKQPHGAALGHLHPLTLQSQGFKFSFCSGRLALYLQGRVGGKQPRQPKKNPQQKHIK